jgi:hypothetical protein
MQEDRIWFYRYVASGINDALKCKNESRTSLTVLCRFEEGRMYIESYFWEGGGYFTTLSVPRLYSAEGRMAEDLERIWKLAAVAQSRYYQDICLQEVRNTENRIDRGQDTNRAPPQ